MESNLKIDEHRQNRHKRIGIIGKGSVNLHCHKTLGLARFTATLKR
jgi:hypothetical protein